MKFSFNNTCLDNIIFEICYHFITNENVNNGDKKTLVNKIKFYYLTLVKVLQVLKAIIKTKNTYINYFFDFIIKDTLLQNTYIKTIQIH